MICHFKLDNIYATVKMPLSLYKSLKNDHKEMVLKNVKDDSFDYSKHKEWEKAKQDLIDAVKNLDEIEQDIRFKLIDKINM